MMRNIEIASIDAYRDPIEEGYSVEFGIEDYEQRITLLREKMKGNNLSHVIVYGDREHFANLEYLTGYDPRFEESLLIITDFGDLTILVGNEGMGYSYQSPLNLNRVLYQNFSLQGQPRNELVPLKEIFTTSGITSNSKVGIVGYKYFEPTHITYHRYKHDIPSYIVDELEEIVDRERIINVTSYMTHPIEGIRMVLRTPKEIAYYEYASNKASNVIIRLLKGLEPGIEELQASKLAAYDAYPISMFPIVNFGTKHVKLGLRSPNNQKLKEGDIITVCYGIRGSLIARSGIAAYDHDGVPEELQDSIEFFYKPYYSALVKWYESLQIGANCGEIYGKVMEIIGDSEQFGIKLNPGHLISLDEWPNSPFYDGSKFFLQSGHYLQADIIASNQHPFKQAIVEDGVILADERLRTQLIEEYPDIYRRMEKRRTFMKEVLGIEIKDDVLPLSNCQAMLHPYLLNTNKVFVIKK